MAPNSSEDEHFNEATVTHKPGAAQSPMSRFMRCHVQQNWHAVSERHGTTETLTATSRITSTLSSDEITSVRDLPQTYKMISDQSKTCQEVKSNYHFRLYAEQTLKYLLILATIYTHL